MGQATKDAEKGLSQKKQIAALTRFREGEFKVLIATSVGEEGLDVPSTDLVIFYEPVPSEIRSIQRKGRTGRSASGKGRRAHHQGHIGRRVPVREPVQGAPYAEEPASDERAAESLPSNRSWLNRRQIEEFTPQGPGDPDR